MSKRFETKLVMSLISILIVSLLYSCRSQASDLQVSLLGATYGSDLTKQKAFIEPEVGFTYSRNNLFYSVTALDIEDEKTSFVIGAGYKEEISPGFYLGGMGSMVMKYNERPSEYREKDSFSKENLAPMAYGLYFLPWIVIEKRLFINDSLAISFNVFVNHLAVHTSVGLTFTFGE